MECMIIQENSRELCPKSNTHPIPGLASPLILLHGSVPPLERGHPTCILFLFQININFWCEGLRHWWFFHVRQWETLAYHSAGTGSHRFVAWGPDQLHVLQNKEAQTHSVCAERSSPLTSARAVLEACSWPPRSILEEVLAPLTVWAICVVLTDTLTVNLGCGMHKQYEKRAHLWGWWVL